MEPEARTSFTKASKSATCFPQKGRVERNHEFIRMILPKGKSFDGLTQSDIDRVMSHVNSYSRPALNDKTPFDLFTFTYGKDILERLNIQRIPSGNVILKPSLLD